jgi:hypothetical protein
MMKRNILVKPKERRQELVEQFVNQTNSSAPLAE